MVNRKKIKNAVWNSDYGNKSNWLAKERFVSIQRNFGQELRDEIQILIEIYFSAQVHELRQNIREQIQDYLSFKGRAVKKDYNSPMKRKHRKLQHSDLTKPIFSTVWYPSIRNSG